MSSSTRQLPQNQIDREIHDDLSEPKTRRVTPYGWDATNLQKVRLGVDSNGALKIANSLIPTSYDYVSVAYPSSSSETYTFKTGGSGGATIATVTVVYTDSTKESLSSVTRT